MMATRNMTGFKVVCPFCHDEDATVSIDLNALQTITCGGCDESFSPRQAAARLAERARRWEAVGRWIDLAGTAADVADAPD